MSDGEAERAYPFPRSHADGTAADMTPPRRQRLMNETA